MGETHEGTATARPSAYLLDQVSAVEEEPRLNLGNRYNEGKPELSYLFEFSDAIQDLCRVCAFGAGKYSRGNWKKGLYTTKTVDSLVRHLNAFMNGEDNDPESGLPHLAHVAWNALALSEMSYIRPELDDRGKDD